ncbi:uncharacterized protein PRD47_002150 isoform 1-T1 [Ara ararauna]
MAAAGGSPARAPTPGSDPPGCCCGDGARSAAGSHSDSLTATFSKVEAQKKPGSPSPLPWHVRLHFLKKSCGISLLHQPLRLFWQQLLVIISPLKSANSRDERTAVSPLQRVTLSSCLTVVDSTTRRPSLKCL